MRSGVQMLMQRSPSILLALSLVFGLSGIFVTPVEAYQVTVTIAVGSNPNGVAVNPLTNRIYVANSDDNTVSVIDGATNAVVDRVHVGTNPSGVAVNPATNRISVTLYGFAGGNTVQVIDGATDAIVDSVIVNAPPWLIDVNPVTNRAYVAQC